MNWNFPNRIEPGQIWIVGLFFIMGLVEIFAIASHPVLQTLLLLAALGLSVAAVLSTHVFVALARIAIPLAIGVISVLLYDSVYRVDWTASFLESSYVNASYVDWFFNFVSILYAVTTAFLLWKGLTDHDMLKHSLNDEANQIRTVVNYTRFFDQENKNNEKSISEIWSSLHSYIDNILRRKKDGGHENDEKIKHILETIKEIKTEDPNDIIALEEIMTEFSELVKLRSKRRNYLDNKMSPFLLFMLLVMSVSIMYPFFTKQPVEGENVVATMIFILGTLLSFMFITMIDIGSPYAGFWKIKTDTLTGLRDELIRDNEVRQKAPKESR